MKKRTRKKKRVPSIEAHVRLYLHELDCPAYRTLSPAARTLLVELRALFNVKSGDNRVFCGIRGMMERCNLTQRAAQRARDELVEKGWIKVERHGGFTCKVKHATVFTLENEPPNSGNGSQPSKAFMRWQPSSAPAAASIATKKHGSGIDYRSVAESTTETCEPFSTRPLSVAESTTDKPIFEPSSVAESTTQILLPANGGLCSAAAPAPAVRSKRRRSA